MTLLYINLVKDTEKGILKKILYQKKSLEKYLKIILLENKEGVYFLNNEKISPYTNKNDIFSKVKRKIQEIIILKKILKKENKEINIVYIRYLMTNPFYIYFLKYLKKQKIKIIIEIPTYPEDKEIFGIECINISNGIDLDEIKMIQPNLKENKIVFTSVSNCSFWHGIDRFLYSLEEYKKNSNSMEISFNIIGEGIETNKLKNIVLNSRYLKKIVIFHGFKQGEELDRIYNETNICVGCLGNHRKGIYTLQALKNKEYMAKGLPMIFSEDDPGLRDKKFIFKVTPDEELINIEEIIKWYKNLDVSCEEIRKNAKEFTWDIQMKKVLDNI